MDQRPYHHGDLAKALLDAATAVVDRGGAEALSLRDLAKSLNVSRAAPYRHFPDRDALLAAVAARGFEDLTRGYEDALLGPGDGRARLKAASHVFFDFATARPGMFRLMFESDLLARTPPPAILIPPANACYYMLWRAVSGADPSADERTVKTRTLTMWSTCYGYLSLAGAGRFKPFMTDPLTTEELAAAVIEAAIGG